MSNKVAIVTGGTSGIGRATALALQADGWTVYELSRRAVGKADVRHIVADITKEETLAAAVAQVMEAEGRIDLVVNNAGFGISGAIEFTTTEEAQRLFDANFFGMVRMNRCVVPIMHRQGGGRIINLSSVAAPVAIPFQAYYSAAKAAINAYSSALRCEVAPFGIDVCAVMPGDLKTGFTAAREKNVRGDTEYGGRISRSVSRMEHDEQTGMPPEKAAAFLCRVALRRRTKPLYAIGPQYSAAVLLGRLLPCRLVSWIVSKLYAA